MLRAVRFAAKLDLTLAPETAAPIASLGRLIKDVPSARLFDELLKLFQSGHAVRSFDLLLQYDLLRYLFRDTQAQLETSDRDKIIDFIRRGLAEHGRRVSATTSRSRRCSCMRCSCGSRFKRSHGGWKAKDGTTAKQCSKRASASSRRSKPRFRAVSARR